MGIGEIGVVEERDKRLKRGEAQLDTKELRGKLQIFGFNFGGEEPKNGDPEDCAGDADNVAPDEEDEGEKEDNRECFECFTGGIGFSSGEDKEASEDGCSGVSGTRNEENVTAEYGCNTAPIGINMDVVGGSASRKGHDGVGKFVEVGVKVGEGQDRVTGDGDRPEGNA